MATTLVCSSSSSSSSPPPPLTTDVSTTIIRNPSYLYIDLLDKELVQTNGAEVLQVELATIVSSNDLYDHVTKTLHLTPNIFSILHCTDYGTKIIPNTNTPLSGQHNYLKNVLHSKATLQFCYNLWL